VLVSGSGRTLVNLAERMRDGSLPARIALVIASRACLGAERARDLGLETHVMPGDLSPADLEARCKEREVEWIVLAGYTRLAPIPPAYTDRMLNIHPALLPSFGGPGMHGERVHRAVLDAGCKVSGCTVHLCDATYDTGPIVLQRCCPVEDDDTPETLAARVFDLEREAYPEAIRRVLTGRVSIEGRRARIIPG